MPDYEGRVEIIRLYLQKVKYGPDVNVEKLSRGTTGFTGADIENLVNQAALKAAMDGADFVQQKHLEFARDKILMGQWLKNERTFLLLLFFWILLCHFEVHFRCILCSSICCSRIGVGPERKSRIPDEETNKLTAFHEGGHALVAYYTKEAQTLHKVTIIPRGPSLGHVRTLPPFTHYCIAV